MPERAIVAELTAPAGDFNGDGKADKPKPKQTRTIAV
jgi:hypothetical protein